MNNTIFHRTCVLIMLHTASALSGINIREEQSKVAALDISQDCINGYSTSVHLSHGSGPMDSRIILLRSLDLSFRNCSILIVESNSCSNECKAIVVFEFFNYGSKNFSCSNFGEGILIKSEGMNIVDVCKDMYSQIKVEKRRDLHTYIIDKNKFSVNIGFANFSGTVKITITSAIFLGNYSNCTFNEVSCVHDEQVLCINKVFECDGNFNCGTPGLYDEYCSNLYLQENILFAIVYGSFLVGVVLFFFVQILRMYVPTVAEHFFVFKDGQDFKFVLTSQSLPPVKIYKNVEEEIEQERTVRATDTQIY